MAVSQKVETYFSTYPTRMYHRGEILIQPGDKPQAFYITQGQVAQYDIARNGQKLIVNIFKPGAFIPLSCILNDTASTFFFEASDQTIVQVAPATDVHNFLQDNSDITLDALTRLSRGSDGLLLRLARAMEGDAEERILQELMIIQDRFPELGQEISITDTELSARTGLARETVSRTLKKLDAKGIIKSSRGKIILGDNFHI